MNNRCFSFLAVVLAIAALTMVLMSQASSLALSQAEEPEKETPSVVLPETYNAVTRIHFTNVAVHRGSPEPNPVERRFQVDLKYWLMDSKTYVKGDLGIGNPELVDFIRKLGSKSLPASEPTTLSVMAYTIGRAVLGEFKIVQKVEVRLTHFSKGLEVEDEANDNHVVNLTLQR